MSKKTQTQALATYMARGYKATRLTAMNQMGIANLTAVVSDLRDQLGDNAITMVREKDYNGKRYASYTISPEKMAYLHQRGRIRNTVHGPEVIVY